MGLLPTFSLYSFGIDIASKADLACIELWSKTLLEKLRKGKPLERVGRKASGPFQIWVAELPNVCQST